jgi:hypothetical protein
MMDSPPCDPTDPPAEGDTGLLDLPEDCLGLVLDLLDPVTVAILERVSRSLHTMIQAHQYWRKALIRLVHKHPYLSHSNPPALTLGEEEERLRPACKKAYRGIAKELNTFWRKNDKYKPSTQRNCQYFCQRDDQQKIVNIRVTGEHFLTILGPRTRSDPTVYTIRVFSRSSRTLISEVTDLKDKPEYLVFSPRHDLMVAKAHECSPSTPDTIHVWSLSSDPEPLLRAYNLKASGHAARCTTLVLKEDIYFGSSRKDAVLMCPTRYSNKSVVRFLALSRPSSSTSSSESSSSSSSTNSTPSPCPPSLPQDVQNRVAVEEVGRVHIGHLVQLGVADFTEKWALLFTEAPKELPDRNIHLIVIEMASMTVKHILKAYEPRIAVYGAALHQQEPDVAVAVGKDGYLKVFDLDAGRELTNQRVPKPMARTNTTIIDFFGTTRFMLGSITDIHVFDLQFPLYPSPEAKLDRIERRREHIRTVSIYGEVWDMVEERALQLAPPPGEDALDPLMQLQQNLAALNQVNQAIEANIVRPELPEEADRVEQLLVEFRAVQQRIHDLNQEMEARISVAIEAVAADLRHIYVLTNTGDIMTFDFGDSRRAEEELDD